MPSFKIATWNVNSLRVRLPHVLEWAKIQQPDLIALQETKIPDTDFPHAELEAAGYVAVNSGQRTYNGVAILWREKAQDIITEFPGYDDPQRRILGVTVDDVRIINIYIPNGQSVGSDKFEYKLTWLSYLEKYLETELKKYPKLIVCGDFNIAPGDLDVYEPLLWEGKILFSEPEKKVFSNLINLGLEDCYRKLNPNTKEFSWWDYRVNAFKRNQGARIDHILASEVLANNCTKCIIDKTPRGWDRPSDHTPVLAEFNV